MNNLVEIFNVFGDVVDFLKKEGVWDILVEIYNALKIALKWLYGVLNVNGLWDILLWLIKLFLRIFVALFNVIKDIYQYIQGSL